VNDAGRERLACNNLRATQREESIRGTTRTAARYGDTPWMDPEMAPRLSGFLLHLNKSRVEQRRFARQSAISRQQSVGKADGGKLKARAKRVC